MRPSQRVAACCRIGGKPFSFRDRPHLVAVYDAEARNILLKCGRQVEKSTTGTIMAASFLAEKPYRSVIYVAPRIDQSQFFSRQRFAPIVRDFRGEMADRLIPLQGKHTINYRAYSGDRYIVFCHGQRSGESVRGYTGDMLILDELQSIESETVPVAREALSHSPIKRILYLGTPLSMANHIEDRWRRSTRCEWVVKCSHCGSHQIPGVASIQPHALVCLHCGGDLRGSRGSWVAETLDAPILGFRIPQTVVSWNSPEDLYEKLSEYSRPRFYNEVLGLPYESSLVPFPADSFVPPLTDPGLDYLESLDGTPWANETTYMGVDWGSGEGSYTVVVIGAWQESRFRLLQVRYFTRPDEMDLDWQVEEVSRMIRSYRVTRCVVDWGFGANQLATLRHTFGNRVVAAFYTAGRTTIGQTQLVRGVKVDNRRGMVFIRKSRLITDLHLAHKHHLLLYPTANRVVSDMLAADMIREYAEYRKVGTAETEELYYDHPAGTKDDGLHALAYSWLAAKLEEGKTFDDVPETIPTFPKVTFAVAHTDGTLL